MPELPEVASRASEMQRALKGKTLSGIEVLQPKCLNLPAARFKKALKGARILDVSQRGKWILVHTDQGWLLLNLGMGGELLLTDREHLPEKRRLIFDFEDDSCLAVNFWWFGYAHYASEKGLERHAMTAKLGPDVLGLGGDGLRSLLKGRRGSIKSFLLNQERIAGIGNAYIHDILFLARLHPLRTIDSLSETETDGLWKAICKGLEPSLRKGGAWYELDLYGKRGRFKRKDILIGYAEGKPCPVCDTAIKKLKTGSTSSFICPSCQALKPVGKRQRAKKEAGAAAQVTRIGLQRD